MIDQQALPAGGMPGATDREPGIVVIGEERPRETAVVVVRMAMDGISTAIGTAFGEVAAAMAQAGVDLDGPPFTRYLAFGAEIEAEAGFPVRRPAPDVGRVHPGRLPGGRHASIIHVGPYDTLHETYAVLMGKLATLGLEAAGPMWETYWSDPETEPEPATWRTEVIVPVR